MGDAVSSVLGPYVARRSSLGWTTTSATSPQVGVTSVIGSPLVLVPSSDFSKFAFGSFNAGTRYSPEEPAGPFASVDLYLTEDPFIAPLWLGKPTISNAIPKPGENQRQDFVMAGATPTLSTIYFAYSGTLVKQDESRSSNVGNGMGASTDPWGFYEWSKEGLGVAGILPEGTVSPFGAAPAAVAGDGVPGGPNGSRGNGNSWQATDFNNEVSADGSRAFFVSPDPMASTVTNESACEEEPPCTNAPPELYVRKTVSDGSKSTVLASQSQLSGHFGEPAPSGPVGVNDASVQGGELLDSAYVYASPDGSQAFFASGNRLTEAAPENKAIKEYDFDVDTGALAYLPGVVGPIVASSHDGLRFVFENTATVPFELDLWTGGPGGGHVTPIAQLPTPEVVEESALRGPYEGALGVEARASTDGSVFVFDTNAPIPGGFNNLGGHGQAYRYDVNSNKLTCVSCPPAGVSPSGNAYISFDNFGGTNAKPRSTVDTRAMSSDGSRVFFDTPDPLVARDSNGKRDIYEWENGAIYLISSGTNPEDSFYLDNSESGDDVFFNTVGGMVAGDTDSVYDAYDARIPHPGDTSLPPAAAPCQGDVCQGPPSVPSLLSVPPSATFSGAGNVTPPETKPPAKKKKKKARHKTKRKKGRRTAAKKSVRKSYMRKS
jgi:hypothetical protein